MNRSRVVIAPDSFKGSLSARQVADALARGLKQAAAESAITVAPMADGGEGTLDCVAASCAATWQSAPIKAIHDIEINARWLRLADDTAVIECADVLGLPLIQQMTNAPALRQRSSAALGRLIGAALDAGACSLTIGLGGSACNDAGLGLLLALGAQAFDAQGVSLAPSMASLEALERLDLSGLDRRLDDRPIRVFCDVDNPLLGERGASRVYGPQKGLGTHEIAAIEAAIERMAASVGAQEQMTQAGSGAAGGLGFALALLGAVLEPGAQALMALTGLDTHMTNADCVITGEGRSDRQTLAGKLPLAVARAARPTPAWLVSGAIADDARNELAREFTACRTLVERAGSPDAALAEPERWLSDIGYDLGCEWERRSGN